MLLGKMCNPEKDVSSRISQLAREGFRLAEITIESPGARPERRDWKKIKRLIDSKELKVIGSTDFNLQIASPWMPVRKAAVSEIKRAFPILGMLGAEYVHIHPDHSAKRQKKEMFKWNDEAVKDLKKAASRHGLKLMVENGAPWQGGLDLIRYLLRRNPDVYLLLDIGHANLGVERNLAMEYFRLFRDRISHVHMHDNDGKRDQHLELGKGNIDWKEIVGLLKKSGYDKTITLETFNPEGGFARSKRKFERLWKGR